MTAATAELCGHRWPFSPPSNPMNLVSDGHRCDEPADHPAPCTCRCGAATTRRGITDA